MSERKQLPVKNFEDAILEAVNCSSVIIIRGQTGCGKTTQVPQYILDDYIKKGKGSECNIVVTQVREKYLRKLNQIVHNPGLRFGFCTHVITILTMLLSIPSQLDCC